jgi:hypothetical protein
LCLKCLYVISYHTSFIDTLFWDLNKAIFRRQVFSISEILTLFGSFPYWSFITKLNVCWSSNLSFLRPTPVRPAKSDKQLLLVFNQPESFVLFFHQSKSCLDQDNVETSKHQIAEKRLRNLWFIFFIHRLHKKIDKGFFKKQKNCLKKSFQKIVESKESFIESFAHICRYILITRIYSILISWARKLSIFW